MTLTPPTMDAMLGAPPGKPKLLVVDDQPINIQIMHQVFDSDYQVFMATNGAQALALCQSNPPDLVLLDIVMPGMDGFEVCTQLKAQETTRNIPVIFVTAHTDPAQETHGLSLGAVDFISKPITPAVVQARVRTHLTLKFQSDLLRKMAFLDGLTGVFNRRFFDQQLATEWARASRGGTPLSLILIDVDHFKVFNDHYGHLAGDDCLRQIAATLKSCLRRPGDLVARFGGEEFACILPETAFDDAMALAAELERRVRDLQVPHAASSVGPVVTVSLGVGARTLVSNADPLAMVRFTDTQLYQAKARGRAQVCGAVLPAQKPALQASPMP